VHTYLDGRVLVDWSGIAVAEPLVRPLVARLTGVDPGPLHHLCPFCGSVEHGRPYVDAPVHVSVAHVTGLTLVAVSDVGRVGVDIDAAGDDAWVRREAVGKALGTGITEEALPDPQWQAPIEVPGHRAVVVLLSEPAAAAGRPGTASYRTGS
jgi:hypothetical protein